MGQVKWFADQLKLMNDEPFKAIDYYFADLPSCILSGCEVDGTTVKSGLVLFTWTESGTKKSMVVPFDGANGVTFPQYFVLSQIDNYRYYENGGSKIFSSSYKAVLSGSIPGSGAYFKIESTGNACFAPFKPGILSLSSNTVLDVSAYGKTIEATGTITITFPNSMPDAMRVDVVNVGTGVITLAASGTLQSKSSYAKIVNRYAGASVYHRGANVWLAVGDLSA